VNRGLRTVDEPEFAFFNSRSTGNIHSIASDFNVQQKATV